MKRPRSGVIERRRQVADYALMGWTQAAIARHLRIPQGTVSPDLAAMRQFWRDFPVHDFEQVRREQLPIAHDLQNLSVPARSLRGPAVQGVRRNDGRASRGDRRGIQEESVSRRSRRMPVKREHPRDMRIIDAMMRKYALKSPRSEERRVG